MDIDLNPTPFHSPPSSSPKANSKASTVKENDVAKQSVSKTTFNSEVKGRKGGSPIQMHLFY